MTWRAARTLRQADWIACEDTRVTAKLLRAVESERPMIAFHEHSSAEDVERVLALAAQHAVALVSDAGTPLVSDPGFRLVRAARARGIPVTAVPGPSAAIAALSVAGLPTDRFLFVGFLPPKEAVRRQALAGVAGVQATLVFYEAPTRIGPALADMAAVLGERNAVVARELTKLHEDVQAGTLADLAARFADGARGELVVVVGPPGDPGNEEDALDRALTLALGTMPPGRAAASVAAALGLKRSDVYARALELGAGKTS